MRSRSPSRRCNPRELIARERATSATVRSGSEILALIASLTRAVKSSARAAVVEPAPVEVTQGGEEIVIAFGVRRAIALNLKDEPVAPGSEAHRRTIVGFMQIPGEGFCPRELRQRKRNPAPARLHEAGMDLAHHPVRHLVDADQGIWQAKGERGCLTFKVRLDIRHVAHDVHVARRRLEGTDEIGRIAHGHRDRFLRAGAQFTRPVEAEAIVPCQPCRDLKRACMVAQADMSTERRIAAQTLHPALTQHRVVIHTTRATELGEPDLGAP